MQEVEDLKSQLMQVDSNLSNKMASKGSLDKQVEELRSQIETREVDLKKYVQINEQLKEEKTSVKFSNLTFCSLCRRLSLSGMSKSLRRR